MKKLRKVAENKINNRFTDVAKVVLEVEGIVFKEYKLEMASDGPDYAKAMVKQYADKLRGKNWICYVSLLHY